MQDRWVEKGVDMKRGLIAGILMLASSPVLAAPDEEAPVFASEMEEMSQEISASFEEMFGEFGDIFTPEPLTAEAEARLPTAIRMTDIAFPVGSFGTIMEESMKPMMEAVMGMSQPEEAEALAGITGVPYEDLAELDEDEVAAALQVFDPDHAARAAAIGELTIDMMDKLFAALEPGYREGLSRAFATRFTQAEMDELLVFFATPLGEKYARQSILVQYDPQMMAMMEQMGPAMGEIMPTFIASTVELAAEYPEPRTFGDLSQAERARIARLLERSEQELEALQPVEDAEIDTDEAI